MGRPKKEQPNHAGGLYEVKITIGKTLDGKLQRKSFYSSISKDDARRQAEEWKIQREVANRTGISDGPGNRQNFGAWALQWLEAKRGTVKPYTYQNTYKVKLEKYILPYFGKADVSGVKQIDVQNFLNSYSYLSEDMLDTLRMILRSIFDAAIDNDLCYKNPAKNVKIKSTYQPSGRKVYTLEQADKLYEYAREKEIIDFMILLKTGIRRSELLALKWEDIDTKQRLIHIRAAVTPSVHETVEGPTKSLSGTRYIPISQELADILATHKGSGYVIEGSRPESFLSPTTYAKRFSRAMHEAAEALSIPELTPHELRHTFGTLLREMGADVYTIQKVMGHSDIGITAKIYVHNDLDVLRKSMGL